MSRLKKVAMGCGALILIFVLIGALTAAAVFLDQPEEVQVSDIQVNPGEETPILTGQSPKRLRVKLDIKYGRFLLQRGEQTDRVLVEGTYDKANFNLETKSSEKGQVTTYEINFESKQNDLSMLYQTILADHDRDESFLDKNKLKILLPANVPIDLEFDLGTGKNRMELTGLSIASIDGRITKGGIEVVMEEPNPIAMTHFDFEGQTGNFHWTDIQNYNLSKANFEANTGQLEVIATGALKKDALINIDFDMGELRVVCGPETNLVSDLKASFADKNQVKESEINPDLSTLTVKGRMAVGEFRMYHHDDPRYQFNQLWRRIHDETAEDLVAKMRELRAEDSTLMRPSNLNSMGYRILRHDEPKKAIEIFKLNVEFHPDYANGYDSLGEAYYEAGNFEEAIASYQKAIDMDPHQDNAQDMLRRIKREMEDHTTTTETPTEP